MSNQPMSATAECILSMSGFDDGGNMTASQIAEVLGLTLKETEALLFRLVLRGELHRWPGIASNPPTYHKPAPFKSLVRERFAS